MNDLIFDATKKNIPLHPKNTFEVGKIDPSAVVKESLTVPTEGSREIRTSEKRFYEKVRDLFALTRYTTAELKALEARIKERNQ